MAERFSKHRFAAKRLRTLSDELVEEKRRVIEDHSAFRALLNISPFNIPGALVDFIATHTTPKLREFKLHKNRIVFTRDMVKKVFGFRCGNRPVQLLKKNEHSELRDVYKGGNGRPDLHVAVNLLKSCANDDVDTILRTWDLICLATVVDPGSGNMISLEYIGSMTNPRRTHEFAWDEFFLELAMKEVQKIQKKKAAPPPIDPTKNDFCISGPFASLAVVYMDHLEFPPNNHVINYSVPRVCFATTDDFKFVVENDLDRKILNNKSVFGRRSFLPLSDTPYGAADPVVQPVEEVEVNPSASLDEWLVFPSSQELEVPARFKHLHEKHKDLFCSDVDTTLKNFGIGLKRMHSQHMSALLNDVHAAMNEGGAPSVEFPNRVNDEDENMDVEDSADDQGTSKEAEVEDVQGSDNAAKQDGVHDAEARKGDEELVDAEATKDDEHASAAKDAEVHTTSGATDEPQAAIVLDSLSIGGDVGGQIPVDSPVRSPYRSISPPPEGISEEAWNNAPDASSMELFPEGSEEYNEMNNIPATTRHAAEKSAAIPEDAACAEKINVALSCTTSKSVEANEAVTPEHQTITDVGSKVQKEQGSSTGIETIEKRNRYKRAAKDDPSPQKLKKTKVCQDDFHTYDKFVIHERKFKKKSKLRKAEVPKIFLRIGRHHCSYRSFLESFRPRQCLSSEVMSVWVEKFNHVAKACAEKNPRQKKKYAFSSYFTSKLVVDPAVFNPADCMREFKEVCSKFKILKGDLIYLPIVADNHWIVPCFNLLYKQFHTFDSMLSTNGVSSLDRAAHNLFSNFIRTANESQVCNIDFGTFKFFTPDHPQQETLFDCGFYAILFMEYYNAKFMAQFENEVVPDFRKVLAANLIDSRDNHDEDVAKIMEEDLQFA